jgi:hypothetical protein
LCGGWGAFVVSRERGGERERKGGRKERKFVTEYSMIGQEVLKVPLL